MKKICILMIVVLFFVTGCSQNNETTEAQEAPVTIEEDIDGIAYRFIQVLRERKTDELLNNFEYDQAMTDAFTEKMIKDIYADLDKNFGDMEEVILSQQDQQSGYDIISVIVKHEKGYLSHNVVFNSDKLISGYNYRITVNPEEHVIDNRSIEEIAVAYANSLGQKDVDVLLNGYVYDATMASQFTKNTIESILDDLEKKYGAFIAVHTYTMSKQGVYDIVSVICEYDKLFISLNVVFDDAKNIAGLNYYETTDPNEDTSTFKEQDVTFGDEAWPLTGKLSIPEVDGPIPVVVLVHGSGPNDMNETIYGNKPFYDIAKGLYEQGIAVLRYDKRTFTHVSKFVDDTLDNFTIYDETVDDAVYAVNFLNSYEAYDFKDIYVLGHSLGANQGPRIALETDLSGLLLVAGNVTPLHELMLIQYNYIFKLDGVLADNEKTSIAAVETAVDKINSENIVDYDSTELLGIGANYWLDLRHYNPVVVAQGLDVPISIYQGGRDYQVPMSEFDKWQEGLPEADYYTYPSLNHLMIAGEGVSTPDEYKNVGNVDITFIQEMAEWIKKHRK